ncbi:MAG: thioredoxin family protein [Candidatus Sericytochromatia bacterium]|nr:thioredoxin family protein [Candidatus Sericytochromatia bacterium]
MKHKVFRWLWLSLPILLSLLLWPLHTAMASPLKEGSSADGYTRYINHSEVKLLSSHDSLSASEDTLIGLHIRLDPEWHTYWRNPGDSGAAPMLNIQSAQAELVVGEIQWPLPERIPTPPLVTFGYENEVLIFAPVRLKAPAADLKELSLSVEAEWLVCKVECIPAFDSFSLPLAVAQKPVASASQALFASWQQQIPPQASSIARYRPGKEALQLEISGLPTGAKITDFFPVQSPFLSNAAPQLSGQHSFSQALSQPLPDPAPTITGLVLYEVDGLPGSLHISAEVSSGSAALLNTERESRAPPLWQLMLMAFAGGLILNIMPCVFPIIAIKLLSILKQAEERTSTVRLSSLAYIAGVLVTFEAFALLLVLLRASGQALGWGFQLQSPGFLTALILLFFLLSLNFLGLYEFRLPLLQTGPRKQGYGGQFATGALSVFVASPCTAPFMGAAMGFALSQSISAILLVFLGLGLGFALPYLLLLISPRIVSWLPKPGQWMLLFKEFMFFPMLLTALWLLWILGRIAGLEAAIAVLAGLTLLAIPFWLRQRLSAPGRLLFGAWLICLPLGLGLTVWPLLQPQNTQTAAQTQSSSFWQPFSPAALATAQAAGPVFVNFTAAWCITCQVNEQVTFRDADTQALIQQAGIQMLKADWTRRDPEITAILSYYDRVSVPFYLFYPSANSEPVILPEVLTPAIFKRYLSNTDPKETAL